MKYFFLLIWCIFVVLVVGIVVVLMLVGCSIGGDVGFDGSMGFGLFDFVEVVFEKGGEIMYWLWMLLVEVQVEVFEKEYLNVIVNFVNVGMNNEEYMKLQNVIKVGFGVFDVVQIEYYVFLQFVLMDVFIDFLQYGFVDFEDDYIVLIWNLVSDGDVIYGLLQDLGFMVLFYNKIVFDVVGVVVFIIWDEYYEVVKVIYVVNLDVYIINDMGDVGFVILMIWQVGGKLFEILGIDVMIDLQDDGLKKWIENWNCFVEDDLFVFYGSWSDEWFCVLGDGSFVSFVIGVWMFGNFILGVFDGVGDWCVVLMFIYDGFFVMVENGGGGQVVIKQSKNLELVVGFLWWLNNFEESILIFFELGGFLFMIVEFFSDEFFVEVLEYFGGQKINEVLVVVVDDVVEGWSYLLYQVYVNSIFGDIVGQLYQNGIDLNEGFVFWQDVLVEYGNVQGFIVNKQDCGRVGFGFLCWDWFDLFY